MQLWRNPDAFDASRGSLAAWLAVISRHRSIDRLRKRRPEIDIEDCVIASGPDLRDETERKLVIEKVRGVLAEMSPDQRNAYGVGIFPGPDPHRDSGENRRAAGHGQDPDSQRLAAVARQVCSEADEDTRTIRRRPGALRAGRAGRSDRQELEQHLETCAACRRELQALRGDLGLLGSSSSGPSLRRAARSA